MRHDCKNRLCDTPHEPPQNRHWNELEKKYVTGRTAWERQFCEHGFRRAPGTPWDCSECQIKERGNVAH